MEIEFLLNRLNAIDVMLRNRTYISSKMIGDQEVRWTEQKYDFQTISNISDEKSSIINRLEKEGLICNEEMSKYYLSEDYAFTPKISYKNVNLLNTHKLNIKL